MTTMNNEDPADPSVHEPGVECLHPQIITYAIADQGPEHGKPAGLWACAECGRKFEPMQIAPRSAEAVAAERERQTKPPKWWTCQTHGDAQPNAWGCPECVREMRSELDALRLLVRELRGRLERVKSEPQDTMSDSKAVSAMVRHAKLGLQAIERLDRAAGFPPANVRAKRAEGASPRSA